MAKKAFNTALRTELRRYGVLFGDLSEQLYFKRRRLYDILYFNACSVEEYEKIVSVPYLRHLKNTAEKPQFVKNISKRGGYTRAKVHVRATKTNNDHPVDEEMERHKSFLQSINEISKSNVYNCTLDVLEYAVENGISVHRLIDLLRKFGSYNL